MISASILDSLVDLSALALGALAFAAPARRWLLHVDGGIDRQAVELARAFEDAVQQYARLGRVFDERSTSASQRSIIGVVIDSIGCSPDAGSRCERTSAL